MLRRSPRHGIMPTGWSLGCPGGTPVSASLRGESGLVDYPVLRRVRGAGPAGVRRLSVSGQSVLGSSTTPAFQERQAFGWGCAAVLRSTRQTGQLPGRGQVYRSPPARRACRSPISSICRKAGRTTLTDAPRQVCRRMSSSAPSPKSPSRGFGRR